MANAKLRIALEKGETVMAPGVYDAVTAKLMRHLGFEYLYVPGSQTGTVLATTEPLTTLTHMAEVGRSIERGVRGEMPVVLDAGAGFGEPVHVMQTVRTLELAGMSAIHIEDQFYPKRASYFRGLEHVVPIDVFQQRLEYAMKAKRSKDFLIIGRTDGWRAAPDPWVPEGGSVQEVIKRTKAADEAGVDILFPIGLWTEEDYKLVRREVPDKPMMALMFGPQSPAPFGVKEFESWGYQLIHTPFTSIAASLTSMQDAFQQVLDSGKASLTEEQQARLRDLTRASLVPEVQGSPRTSSSRP
jgi:methylisocitrate lyase